MLLFTDSFDHYPYSQMTRKWSTITGSGNGDIGSGYGRNGSNGWRPNLAGSATNTTLNLTANASTLIIGFAIKFPVPGQQCFFFRFIDSATTQITLIYNTDGSLGVYRGDVAAHLGTTAPGALPTPSTVHNYVELKVTFHPSAGTVDLRVNGVSKLSLTGQNTRASANSSANQIQFGGGSPNASWHIYIDDLYLCDATGSTNNNFLGDVRVECLFPSTEGSEIDLTPSTGTDNSANVDETSPNDDTDYNSSTNPGDRDKYGMTDLVSTIGSVLAVAVNSMDRKDDSGTRTHSHILDSLGVESVGTAFSPTTTYSNHQTIYESKPGGGALTITDVNAIEVGFEITT
jgi:hypothetical protein